MNMSTITIQDCIDNAEKKGKYAVVNDGGVVGFEEE